MNEIKIYLKTSGRIAELYKDFDLYEGCYRNSQMSVYVPKSLLYENEDGTFANLVKTGAILTAPNGTKLTTKSYYLDYVKTETVGGIAYAVYTIITPKEFCVYSGTQTVVVNVESIDNTDKDNQKIISVTTTQTANLIVLESAYLGQDEPIEPTELDKIKATLKEIEGKLNFDDTPTIGSDNPVTSDGIAKALNTKASLQEDNTFEGYNTFRNEAYFDNAAYFDAGTFMYGMNYYLTDGPNRDDYYCYLTYSVSKILMRFWMSSNQFDIEIPQKAGTIALLSDITPIEEEVAKKYDKTGGTIDGNVQITGDLTVQGTTITENAETLDVKANVITTNSEGVPLINLSGLGIRTDATNVYGIMYDPQSDSVKLGLGSLDEDNNFTFNQGEGLPIAVRDDSTAFTDKHVIVWDAAGDKFVDGGKAVSDLPTLAGDNDFTGINRFIIPITIGTKAFPEISIGYTSMTWRTDANTFYTYSYPTKSGTFAFTSDIPTDYATQTALANTQRQVDGLYTLLEQKNEIYVQTASDTYTTRETAGGENIADGVQTPVKKITGKTVKTTNLIRRPYVSTTSSILGVKCTVNDDGSITFNGTATGVVNFVLYNINDCYLSEGTYTFKLYGGIQSEIYFVTGGAGSTVPIEYGDRTITLEEGTAIGNFNIQIPTGTVVNNVTVYPMLNEGSTALPYMPYFSGLKNAFFKEIVSTGRNLIPYPYADKTKTINGITFTVNNDGTINVNGTATELTTFWLFNKSKNLPLGMSVGKMYTISLKGGSDNCYIYTNYIDSAGEAHGAGLSSNTGNTPTNTVGEEWKGLQIYIVVTQGTALNNVTVYPMLNYGSSALPYEPYTQSVLSLPEAVENGEWNTIDIENGKNILQGFTKTFDGTEDIQRTFKTYDYGGYPVLSMITNPYSYNDNATVNLITGIFNNVSAQSLITNKEEGICTYGEGGIRYFLFRINPIIYGCTMDSTDDELIAGFKAYLAAQHTAGNPLVVRYKTEEIQSETDISPSADSYIAWKNGSETIEQGDTDNSIYGAENTVDQDYYLLTAPEEVTKE